MKRRVAPILTFTLALIIVSSIAYASKKKDPVKSSDLIPDKLSEEEAFKAEMLNATEDHKNKSPGTGSSKKVVPAKRNLEDQIAKQPEK